MGLHDLGRTSGIGEINVLRVDRLRCLTIDTGLIGVTSGEEWSTWIESGLFVS